MPRDPTIEERWYKMLPEGGSVNHHLYHLYGWLASDPPCKLCAAPFKNRGGFFMRLIGREQSKYNPRFCGKSGPVGVYVVRSSQRKVNWQRMEKCKASL